MHILCNMTSRVYVLLSLIILCPYTIHQIVEKTDLLESPPKCVIIQEKQSISIPHSVPSFLGNPNRSQCQAQNAGNKMLRCGRTDVYLKPECVCSFYNVFEASLYHSYSSCPEGSGSDIVTQLKCSDCKKYSLNNNGPCINGGKLTCRGDEVAPSSTCECPPNYEGMFCEEKIEKVTRICYRISRSSSAHGLRNCHSTGKECVTYSKNMLYAYKCNEFHTSKRRQSEELPLCFNIEDVIPDKMPAETEFEEFVAESSSSLKTGGISSTDVRWTVLIMFGSYYVFL